MSFFFFCLRRAIKLADFGVAMKLTDAHAQESVVGSPYWLAPEIIEMSAPTSACDIWYALFLLLLLLLLSMDVVVTSLVTS